jgi:rare lipoprotein A
MKRISLVLAAALFIAPLCAAQIPSTDLSNFRQEGIASWYGAEFNGRPTASGEIFNSSLYTAAHPTLPFGTQLTVTNLNNGRKVNVRVNDRGPFVSSRVIDLSLAAAQMLDMVTAGTAPVLIEAQAYGQAADSTYWAETNSYARSEGGNSSADSQITAPPYPVYPNSYQTQEPVVVQVQPPQQQITQYFQQPVQPAQPQAQQPRYPQQSQQVQQLPSMQQIQPVQQVLPVQQVQQVVQPMRPLAQPVIVPQPQETQQTPGSQPAQSPPANPAQPIQPLQIQIPIEVKPMVNAGSYPPASAAASASNLPAAPPAVSPAAVPAAPALSPAPASPPAPAANPQVTVILTPELTPAAVSPIQVRVKPNSIYRVQVGSFKEARNALAAFERLKGAGLSPVYERNGDFFRVVLSGIPSAEMAGVLQKIQTAGFNDPLLREER